MIEKLFVTTCDWCGREEFSRGSKRDALNTYARCYRLYRFSSVNPLADYLHEHQKSRVDEHLMFCCEECAEKYFEESPEDRGFYKLVKTREKKKR